MRLLLVEDDEMLGEALRAGLRQDGHAVDWARSAGEADTAWIAAGLGLALVKRVAEMHGGDVQFTAGLDGKGLGVELMLPAAAVAPKP